MKSATIDRRSGNKTPTDSTPAASHATNTVPRSGPDPSSFDCGLGLTAVIFRRSVAAATLESGNGGVGWGRWSRIRRQRVSGTAFSTGSRIIATR